MNLEQMKSKAIEANYFYRHTENPIMLDSEYDYLMEQIEEQMGEDEFQTFRLQLFENGGNIKFDYVLGSLEKYKYEESEKFLKWLNKYNIKTLFVSDKIDGCSFEANYRGGKLISVNSKGDGGTGTDWTDKAWCIPKLPKTIPIDYPVDIRGEFSLIGESYKQLGYKNKRNGTAGIFNSDEVLVESLAYVFAYGYQILSSSENINSQFHQLMDWGFSVPYFVCFTSMENICDKLKEHYEFSKDRQPYDMDGLVVSDFNWTNENDKYYPEQKVAFKINSSGILAKVIGVEWEISKSRYLKPVVCIEPIDINGSTIRRVAGYNAKYILDNRIFKGAEVLVIKSGEIIPKIVGIVSHSPEYFLIHQCPTCNSKLDWNGVELQCQNISCGEIKRVEYFIKTIGIENVSVARLEEWNIDSFDQFIAFRPNPNYKSQIDFYSQLIEKVFHNSKTNILRSFSCKGIAGTNFDKLYSKFGSVEKINEMFNTWTYNIGSFDLNILPEGIGELTIENAVYDWEINWNLFTRIINDVRYAEPINKSNSNESNILSGKTFLLTGTLSRGRGEVEAEIKSKGGIIASSVSKNLNYLLVGEKPGSKLDKAKKLGTVEIIFEHQYDALIGRISKEKNVGIGEFF